MYLEELFEKYADWKILKYFLDNPEKKIHVKGLARELKISPGTASKALNNAAKDNILRKEVIANVHLYSLNIQNKQCMKLKEVVKEL